MTIGQFSMMSESISFKAKFALSRLPRARAASSRGGSSRPAWRRFTAAPRVSSAAGTGLFLAVFQFNAFSKSLTLLDSWVARASLSARRRLTC